MKNLCSNCKHRATCKVLCKEAEEYANQDYVSKQHTNFSDLGITCNDIPDEEFLGGRKTTLTKRQYQIYVLHLNGYSSRQITKLLQLKNDSYIRRVIRLIKSRL